MVNIFGNIFGVRPHAFRVANLDQKNIRIKKNIIVVVVVVVVVVAVVVVAVVVVVVVVVVVGCIVE